MTRSGMKIWFVYAVRQGDAWILIFVAPADHYAGAEPLFQEILDSFSFTD